MTRDEILKSFSKQFYKKLEASKGGTSDLDQLEYAAFCLMNFQTEFNNGGLHTYFYNSSGDYALQTPDIMRRIGAPQAASILEEASSLFGADGPNPKRKRRWKQLDALGEEAEKRLGTLTDQLFAAERAGLCLFDLFDEHLVAERGGPAA